MHCVLAGIAALVGWIRLRCHRIRPPKEPVRRRVLSSCPPSSGGPRLLDGEWPGGLFVVLRPVLETPFVASLVTPQSPRVTIVAGALPLKKAKDEQQRFTTKLDCPFFSFYYHLCLCSYKVITQTVQSHPVSMTKKGSKSKRKDEVWDTLLMKYYFLSPLLY